MSAGESGALLAAYGVSYSYSGSEPVLSDVSFELERGRILALIGPNGCGKSTLMKLVAGILPRKPSRCSGVVRYAGQDFWHLPTPLRAQRVAYVAPDLRAEFPLSAWETVLMGRLCHGSGGLRHASRDDEDAAQAAMEQCSCWGLRERELHTLSGGERQLVALARALAQGAKVLLLDEALSRMDLHHQAEMGKRLRALAERGFGIMLVSHDLNLAAEWADLALLLNRGKTVAFGPTREVITVDRLRLLYPSSNLVIGANPVTGTPKVFFGK